MLFIQSCFESVISGHYISVLIVINGNDTLTATGKTDN